MFNKQLLSLFSVLFCAVFTTQAQDQINLRNPSFEIPRAVPYGMHPCCKAPRGWFACGGEDLNTPDVQPGHFQVSLPAAEGSYYLGMVTRDNDTWEAVSQRLEKPIEGGKIYTFNLKISYSDILRSQSRVTQRPALYNTPVKVRIWGGSGYCHKAEMLDETKLIEHTNWKQYNFRFKPKKNHGFFTIEVYYKTPTPIPYNGNVLIDDASPIVEVPIDEEPEPPVVEVPSDPDQRINVPPTKPKVEPEPKDDDRVVVTPPPPTEPKEDYKPKTDILKLDRKKMVEGQVIRIEKLYFEADSANITTDGLPVLDEIYAFLRANPDISIEVGGHTNNRCETVFCDKLSRNRAKAVADYLTARGIRQERLLFRGYGKRNPVATNATSTGRKRNQRVEIKILSLDG